MRYFAATMTRAESDAWAARMRAHFADHGWGFWVVAEAATGDFVGVVGLMTIPWQADFTPAVEIGWRIGSRFRRQGYAAQAARAALGFGFATLGLDKIVAFTVPGNAASWKLMEKLGMRHEGEFDHPRLPEGHHYRRHLLYSLTEARWRDAARLG
jgi:RimJ/RimL family protein N-acetyltransferase